MNKKCGYCSICGAPIVQLAGVGRPKCYCENCKPIARKINRRARMGRSWRDASPLDATRRICRANGDMVVVKPIANGHLITRGRAAGGVWRSDYLVKLDFPPSLHRRASTNENHNLD